MTHPAIRAARSLAVAALFCAALPLAAQRPETSADWIDGGKASPRPKLADIAVPRAAAGVPLRKLTGARPGGADNMAQYESDDGELFATAYIYRPSLPDAALSAIATEASVRALYGAKATIGPETIVPAGGVPNAAYRRMFDNLDYLTKPGVSLGMKASYAAFMQAGDWIVKLRVSGPQARRAQVAALGDALLAGLAFGKDTAPRPALPYTVEDCPDEAIAPAARRLPVENEAAVQELMIAAALAGAGGTTRPGGDAPRFCTLEQKVAANGTRIILRRLSGDARTGPDLMLLGDAGNIVSTLSGVPGGSGHAWLVLHSVGGATLAGPFDRRPSLDQYRTLTGGDAGWIGAPVAQIVRKPNGRTSVQLDASLLAAIRKTP